MNIEPDGAAAFIEGTDKTRLDSWVQKLGRKSTSVLTGST